MNVYVRLEKVAIDNLALSNTPHHRSFGCKRCQEIALPALLSSPPVLILAEVKCFASLDTCLVYILVSRPSCDGLGWVAKDVDVFAVGVSVGGNISKFGRF